MIMSDPINTPAFQAQIKAQIAEIDAQEALGKSAQQTVALDQQSVGRLSRMDAMQQQAMAQATRRRRDIQRGRLVAALTRIEAGDYGFCNNCGDDIPPSRLELDPASVICVSCANG